MRVMFPAMPYWLFGFVATEPKATPEVTPSFFTPVLFVNAVARLRLLVAHSCGVPLTISIGSAGALIS